MFQRGLIPSPSFGDLSLRIEDRKPDSAACLGVAAAGQSCATGFVHSLSLKPHRTPRRQRFLISLFTNVETVL